MIDKQRRCQLQFTERDNYSCLTVDMDEGRVV